MDISYQTLLIITGLFLPFYWLFYSPVWKKICLIAYSFFFLMSVSPFILVLMGGVYLYGTFLFHLAMRFESFQRNYWYSFWIFIPLLGIGFVDRSFWRKLLSVDFVELNNPHIFLLSTIGASYYIIKNFIILRESVKVKKMDHFSSITALMFFPSFAAGPIFGYSPFENKNIPARQTVKRFILGFSQIFWGGAALYVIAPFFKAKALVLSDPSFTLSLDFLGFIYLDFAGLFFDFSGYTAIALGIGNLFGISLPINFNRPYLARNMREFWQRWHISLGKFISTYLFNPFIRKTGSAPKAIFLAFCVIGLWHEISLSYFLWGVGHGFAMALAMKPLRFWKVFIEFQPVFLSTPLRIFITLTWAASLSWVANYSILNVTIFDLLAR